MTDKLLLWHTFPIIAAVAVSEPTDQIASQCACMCMLSFDLSRTSQTRVHLPWGRSGSRWAAPEETASLIPLYQVCPSLICRQLVVFGVVKPVSCVAEMYKINPHISARSRSECSLAARKFLHLGKVPACNTETRAWPPISYR